MQKTANHNTLGDGLCLAATNSAMLLADVGEYLTKTHSRRCADRALTLYQMQARAAVVYLGGLIVVRIGKSASNQRTTSVDVILGFILGRPLEPRHHRHASISGTLVGSAVIVAVHWALTAIACRSHGFGNLLKGTRNYWVETACPA